MARFTGKAVIVTGSSIGIGRSTAVLFGREGAKVTITARSAEKLEETKNQLLKAGVAEANINVIVGDITEGKIQDELINSTVKKFGKLDILVNNAGAMFADKEGKRGVDQGVDLYQKIFKLNVQTVIELVQKAKSHLAASKGEIVNVSSIVAGPQAVPSAPYYAMSKAALDQYTRCISIDLIPLGIRVNSVSPGLVATNFIGAAGAPAEVSQKLYDYYGSRKECVPVGAVGQPENIADAIAFLSDRKASSYILGRTIVADGGSSLISGAGAHDFMDIMSS